MNSICKVCNGLEEIKQACSTCHIDMEDQGRIMDYFDDYSAYLEIDGMKMFDGIKRDNSNQECPHTLYCPHCGNSTTLLVKEM